MANERIKLFHPTVRLPGKLSCQSSSILSIFSRRIPESLTANPIAYFQPSDGDSIFLGWGKTLLGHIFRVIHFKSTVPAYGKGSFVPLSNYCTLWTSAYPEDPVPAIRQTCSISPVVRTQAGNP